MADLHMTVAPKQSESDVNHSKRRQQWQSQNIDESTRTLLERDSASFLHQSVSTPCLSVISKAKGIWINDTAGRRYMDFHGNNVHHVGYAHPKVIAA
jgi:4-aminobutyrate aminotransferase